MTRRRALKIGAALLLIAALQPWILAAGHDLLHLRQPVDDCRLAMVATMNKRCFATVADWIDSGAVDQVLLVDQRERRTVQIGLYPSIDQTGVVELTSRGVPRDRIQIIKTGAWTSHELFRRLDEVLVGDPQAHIAVITSSRTGRYFRHVIDDALASDRADHYRIHGLSDDQVNRSTWWRSRSGISKVMLQGFRLAFAVFVGESQVDRRDPYAELLENLSRSDVSVGDLSIG